MPIVRVPQPIAVEIAGLNNVYLQSAINRGLFPCIPPTLQGKTRWFDEPALVSLVAYRHLVDFGLSVSSAGKAACEVEWQVRSGNRKQVTYQVFPDDRLSWMPAEAAAPSNALMSVTFNIPDILATLEKRLAEVLTRDQAQMLVASATAEDTARQAQIDADIAYQDAMVAMDHPEMVTAPPAAPKAKAPRKTKPTTTTAETAAKPRRRK